MYFSIVIVSLNGSKPLPLCIESLRKTDYKDFEVILVDNGSSDGTSRLVKENYPEVKVITLPKNLGFAGGNNVGIKASKGDVIVLLNDDTEPYPDWLNGFKEASNKLNDWGILGCKLLYPDRKTIQHAGAMIKPTANTYHFGYGEEDKGQYDIITECDYVTGAAFAIKRELIDKIGLLDDGYFPIYFEESDYCWRASKAGYKSYYIPKSVVIHHESRTTKKLSFGFYKKYHTNRIRFVLKNYSFIELLKFVKNEVVWFYQNKPFDLLPSLIAAYTINFFKLPMTLKARYGGENK